MDAPPRYTAAAVHIFAVLPASPPSAFCIRVALFSLRELQAVGGGQEEEEEDEEEEEVLLRAVVALAGF
ncbi:hypothetical protein AK812_SmicGene32884 [Symbiodinium microadriaticum]|uniref:Uncharacterized protein n=1 Tax=Symbiodinium microadriaticum TaxID=2951 RepID=A0A1Q9CT13_SYMMI|nr:hypothetical protein AK812_SmicGene32884 [Symbiodinium microadriaticum]